MFDLNSWGELLIIIIAAIILVRPDDMPRFLSFLGKTFRLIQNYMLEMRDNFDCMTDQVDLECFQQKIHKNFEYKIEININLIKKLIKKNIDNDLQKKKLLTKKELDNE